MPNLHLNDLFLKIVLIQEQQFHYSSVNFIQKFSSALLDESFEEGEYFAKTAQLLDHILLDREAVTDNCIRVVEKCSSYDLTLLLHFFENFFNKYEAPVFSVLLLFWKTLGEIERRGDSDPFGEGSPLLLLRDARNSFRSHMDELNEVQRAFLSKISPEWSNREQEFRSFIFYLSCLYWFSKRSSKSGEFTSPFAGSYRFPFLSDDDLEVLREKIWEISSSDHDFGLSSSALSSTGFGPLFLLELKQLANERLSCLLYYDILNLCGQKAVPFEDNFLHQLTEALPVGESEKIRALCLSGNKPMFLHESVREYSVTPGSNFVFPDESLGNSPENNTRLVFFLDERHSSFHFSHPSGENISLHDHDSLFVDDTELLFQPSRHRLFAFPRRRHSITVTRLSVKMKGHHILRDISLEGHSGEVLAICGSSGCGKTTLVSALAGRIPYEGEVYYDDRQMPKNEGLHSVSAYVPQENLLFRELTVRETLAFSTRIRLKLDKEMVSDRVYELMSTLGLKNAGDLHIGDESWKGISGGQRKRVHIGNTIIADRQKVLLFDEPTAGLDPSTGFEILQLLRLLSRQGHVVIVVTHDISPQALSLFDRITLLTQKGEVCFSGLRDRFYKYFGVQEPLQVFHNLGEHPETHTALQFLSSEDGRHLKESIAETRKNTKLRIDTEKRRKSGARNRRPGFPQLTRVLFSRDTLRKLRDSQFISSVLLQPLIIGAIMCWNFSGPVPGELFTLVVSALWIGAISGVREISSEWDFIRKDAETLSGSSSYVLAKFLGGSIWTGLQVFILLSTVVLVQQLWQPPFSFSLPMLFGIQLLTALFGLSLGLAVSASCKTSLTSVSVLPLVLIPMLIMGGLFFRHESTMGLQEKVMTMNPVRQAFEGSILSAKNILNPWRKHDFDRETRRNQMSLWNQYKAHLSLYRDSPELYAKKYGKVQADHLLSAMFDGKDINQREVSRPVPPPEVHDADLLETREALWKLGFKLLPVDRHENLNFFTLFTEVGAQKYTIHTPGMFVNSPGAQGFLGLYRSDDHKDDENLAKSIFPPIVLPLPSILTTLLCLLLAIFQTYANSKPARK